MKQRKVRLDEAKEFNLSAESVDYAVKDGSSTVVWLTLSPKGENVIVSGGDLTWGGGTFSQEVPVDAQPHLILVGHYQVSVQLERYLPSSSLLDCEVSVTQVVPTRWPAWLRVLSGALFGPSQAAAFAETDTVVLTAMQGMADAAEVQGNHQASGPVRQDDGDGQPGEVQIGPVAIMDLPVGTMLVIRRLLEEGPARGDELDDQVNRIWESVYHSPVGGGEWLRQFSLGAIDEAELVAEIQRAALGKEIAEALRSQELVGDVLAALREDRPRQSRPRPRHRFLMSGQALTLPFSWGEKTQRRQGVVFHTFNWRGEAMCVVVSRRGELVAAVEVTNLHTFETETHFFGAVEEESATAHVFDPMINRTGIFSVLGLRVFAYDKWENGDATRKGLRVRLYRSA